MEQLVRVFIVDDDPNAAQLLQNLLREYSVEVIGLATDATAETSESIAEQEPDLLFLDVELPSMRGLEFCQMLRPMTKPDMRVVFYTGYDKYLLEALRQQAFDYLLKPPSRQELAKIMTRYYENRLSDFRNAMVFPAAAERPKVMVVNARGEYTVLRFADIAFFRFDSEKRIWEVITKEGDCHQLRHRTTSDIILAYSPQFVQIHKGYIVNVHHISKILENRCVLLPPLQDVTELRISKNFRPDLMASFYNL